MMTEANRRRIYTAERQATALQREGQDAPSPPVVESGDQAGILEELRSLRALIEQRLGPADERDTLDSTVEIRREIAQMVRSIAQAKTEIANLRHPRAQEDRMVRAQSELDEIIIATEDATNDILAANEKIEKHLNALAALHPDDDDTRILTEQAAAELITILEACNFQDITGQRITKVVKTLRFIEDRILALIGIWGPEAFADIPVPDIEGHHEEIDGPALTGEGISQDEIDKLFD